MVVYDLTSLSGLSKTMESCICRELDAAILRGELDIDCESDDRSLLQAIFFTRVCTAIVTGLVRSVDELKDRSSFRWIEAVGDDWMRQAVEATKVVSQQLWDHYRPESAEGGADG